MTQDMSFIIVMIYRIQINTIQYKLLKSMPHVTQRSKIFQQYNAVILQFHITSSLSQDTWLVAIKTNIQILHFVVGAQEHLL